MPDDGTVAEFPKTALSRRIGDVLAAAAAGPVRLTDHGKPRFVLMTVARFEQLSGRGGRRSGDVLPEEDAALLAALEGMQDI
ncbi:type II toxin-antitoxin system prevent-host-death family antitoxin [Cereibacter sphaeroides]|uniref:type II toxin-antitoxin system prevent-host-death family antitoxin n=1 Tax=Cereibacter sphaeroides TaxID=1063 RepID=UPI001F1D03B1|nr:type II toxin-antitoxin system prevent-host-death family antitoxin [Cereibacter sphaeroides]MCE6967296.1 type II toxin-antitoxin system prevent-host-death family antitoxin [Cereibacter sphaeroides]